MLSVFCWAAAVNYLPVERCLLTHCSLPLWAGETWKLFVCSQYDSRWDQEAARQDALIVFFFCCYIGREASLTTFCWKGVCCLRGYLCVWWSICKPTCPSGSQDRSHTCFPPTFAEQYPAVSDQCRKWKKNPFVCPWSLGFNLIYFCVDRVKVSVSVTVACVGWVDLLWQERAPATASNIVVWSWEHAWRGNDSSPRRK